MEETIDQQWKIFESDKIDKSTTSQQWVEYKTDNVVLSPGETNFKISSKDLDAFLTPSEGALEVRIQLLDAGLNADNDTNATIANDVLRVFRSAEYKVNEKSVERVDYLGLTSLMKHLSIDDPSYSDSQGQMMFWYKDTGLADDPINNNSGFVSRKSRTSDGELNVYIPLRHIFGSHLDKKAMRGVRHTYEFIKETVASEAIHRSNVDGTGASQPDCTFNIISMSIWMPLVKPSLDVLKELEQGMASGASATSIFNEWTGYRSTVYQEGENQPVWRITTSSKKPLMVFVCAQTSQRLGSQRLTSARFDNMHISRVELRINSKVVPEQSYDLSFTNERYTRAYYDWLTATGRHTGDEGSNISWEDFRYLYTVFAFDLHNQEHLYQNVKTNDIEVRLQCNPITYKADNAAYPPILNDNAAPLVRTSSYYLNAVIVSERELKFNGVSGRLQISV